MAFSSVEFLFAFLPLFLIFYTILPKNNIVYLFFSLLFYFVGEGWYILIVIASAAANFYFGLWIDRAVALPMRRWALAVAVASNLTLLLFFKYSGFIATALLQIAPQQWPNTVHLPLGISFYTFHAISYLVDIYRRDARAERSMVNLSLYILMFPQLISGPILRYHTVARQLHRRIVTTRHVYYGLLLFSLGLGQKVLLADTLGALSNPLFAQWQSLSTQTAWLASIAYTLQIFFDFGGYSNMAIGLGWITGFYFPRNFDFPYIARSITEFWRRWHMSLSRWFRDYLYIPLGGNHYGPLTTYRNLIMVFLLCGLWHGAAWTFVLWGAYHGALLVIERLGFGRLLRNAPRIVQHGYTILAVVFGWVIFRADSVGQAAGMMATMIVPTPSNDVGVLHRLTGEEIVTLAASLVFAMPIVPAALQPFVALPSRPPWRRGRTTLSYVMGALIGLVVMLASAIKILSGSYSPFIYYRF